MKMTVQRTRNNSSDRTMLATWRRAISMQGRFSILVGRCCAAAMTLLTRWILKKLPISRASKTKKDQGRAAALPYQIKIASRAMTLIEVLVIIVVIAIGILLLLPAIAQRPGSHIRIICARNLRQVGLAFRIWSGDNGDHYPMSFYTNGAGAPLYLDSSNMFRYFQVMSNELNNPQIVICPQDKTRRAATNFNWDFNSTHISYLIGLDADATKPQMILGGDANLKTDSPVKNGLLVLTTNSSLTWTKDRHDGEGNVLLADGSVQKFSAAAFSQSFIHVSPNGFFTNRLLLPP